MIASLLFAQEITKSCSKSFSEYAVFKIKDFIRFSITEVISFVSSFTDSLINNEVSVPWHLPTFSNTTTIVLTVAATHNLIIEKIYMR